MGTFMSKKTGKNGCGRIAYDIENLTAFISSLATGTIVEDEPQGQATWQNRGPVMGPTKKWDIRVYCSKKQTGSYMPGPESPTCALYERQIRNIDTGALISKRVSVGNLAGLRLQLSRDLSRAWGCEPPSERGFEGISKYKQKYRKRGRSGRKS